MKSSLHRTRNNTKNFTRNLFAGGILATTVASTDLIENLSTTVTQPTANILKCIENTSKALSETLKNTSEGNLLHTTGNILTLAPRLLGSGLEWSRKTLGHTTQYVSAINQTINNNMITLSHANNTTFSTSEKTADISHQEIHLKPSYDLERNGNHWLLKNDIAPRHKFTRWLGNVKNSVINPFLNITRIVPDTMWVAANRVRGVVDSVQKLGKDFKQSWSGVFTNGQTFKQKLNNMRTQGIVGSAKALGNGIKNIVNEGAFKTVAGVTSIGINTVWRMIGNTLLPLFSTKAWREQADNFFASKKWYQTFTHYHQSTPLSSSQPQTPPSNNPSPQT